MNWYNKFLKNAIKGTYTILSSEIAKQTIDIILTLIKNNDINNGVVSRDKRLYNEIFKGNKKQI